MMIKVKKYAEKFSIPFLVDGCQFVAHLPLDVQSLGWTSPNPIHSVQNAFIANDRVKFTSLNLPLFRLILCFIAIPSPLINTL